MPDRGKIISDFEHEVFKAHSEGWDFVDLTTEDAKKILELLKGQPEIVRCKDCKFNSGKCNGLYLQFVTCYKTGSPHKEDWFCADGERQ